jgi:serine protease Do
VTSLLAELEAVTAGAAERVGPSVVGLGRGWRTGSGVVVGSNRVATLAHAVRSEDVTVRFADGRRAEAHLLGADPDTGVALLEADTGEAAAVELATGTPGIGAAVIALADPGGRGLRATLGFVTTAERTLRGPRGRRRAGAIEHTAPLPRGSSGGPLIDAGHRLLGLNAVRLDGGLILAAPIDAAMLERIASGREQRRLGVALAPPFVARKVRRAAGLPDRDGLLVRGVREGSPADRAGLRRGDLIVAVDGSEDDRLDALHAALDGDAPSVELGLVRGADELSVTVTF